MDTFQSTSAATRVLVTGATGLLGTPLCSLIAQLPTMQCMGLARSDLDIALDESVAKTIERHMPHWVVNCAAYTKVDDCESNEEWATTVNGVGAGTVAAAAASIGAQLVHVSTDYVFDGTASNPIPVDAPTGPPEKLSAYGRSKFEGEQAVIKNHPTPMIVRTAWVYGLDGPCFPRAILNLAREGKLKKVVNDQHGAPTFAPDLAEAIIHLITANASGIFHVTNSGSCSWYEFARYLIARAPGIDITIQPCTTAEFPRPARRPAYSVLDLSRYEAVTGNTMRDWCAAADDYVFQLHID